MKTLQFEIEIEASKEKVWDSLWSDSGYRKWTAAFAEGSYAESDWEQGSRILFLSPSGQGMFAVIEEKIPYEKISFKHLGEIKDGVEEFKDWGEAFEKYRLVQANGKTKLQVEVDTIEDFAGYMQETFPRALEILKQVAEQ